MGAYEIRPFREEDRPSLMATLAEVFGAGSARSAREWSWAFERNPAGRRVHLALRDGRVVAQYAGLPIRVWMGGAERTFCQIVDSMVHPDHRAGLKRPGLFVETARAFFEAHGGRDRDPVHYGWPLPEAWRIGQRFLEYDLVRTESALVRELGEAEEPPAETQVEELRDFDRQARWLWDRCARGWAAAALRDEHWLRWRYLEHPTRRYRCLGFRDPQGLLRGLLVTAPAGRLAPGTALIADWLVPEDEPEVGEALVRSAAARERAEGAGALAAILPEWSGWFARLQGLGFRVHPTDRLAAARSFDPRFDLDFLRDGWWYQPGDSDLV